MLSRVGNDLIDMVSPISRVRSHSSIVEPALGDAYAPFGQLDSLFLVVANQVNKVVNYVLRVSDAELLLHTS